MKWDHYLAARRTECATKGLMSGVIGSSLLELRVLEATMWLRTIYVFLPTGRDCGVRWEPKMSSLADVVDFSLINQSFFLSCMRLLYSHGNGLKL